MMQEFVRNQTGYFLIFAGAVLLLYGSHAGEAKVVEAGGSLITAALIAFQAKKPAAENESPKA